MPLEVPSPVPSRARDALLDLYRRALVATETELYQSAINAAVALTESRIGYFHLVNDDQETIELGTWSTGTLSDCTATYARHYPVSDAGVWADYARERRALVHNDFQQVQHRRGYPEGHAHLVRHLGVPVIEGGRVRLLVGVGNKDTDYDDDDVACVQALADHTWTLIRGYRQRLSLALAERQLHELLELTAISLWSWDPEEGRLTFDARVRPLLELDEAGPTTFELDAFARYVDERDRSAFLDALRTPALDTTVDVELRGTGAETPPRTLRFHGSAFPRSQGHGLVLRGALQEVPERRGPRARNGHDSLTGLPGRAAVLAALERHLNGPRREPDHGCAVHVVNLRGFRPVNDTFGRAIGDRVLKLVADRLRGAVHKADLVARLGGDVFAIVQPHAARDVAVTVLAARLDIVLEAPMEIEGLVIALCATSGAAYAPPGGGESAAALLGRAEAAQLEARRTAPPRDCCPA